jgi:nitrite reductase (NO-forming)
MVVSLSTAACGARPQPSSSGSATGGPIASQPEPSQPSEAPAVSPCPTTDILEPDPNAASYFPLDPRAPARLPGTVHPIDLFFHEKFMTIADGIVGGVWTFGGTVPGPVIRVQVGDTVRILLHNTPPPRPPIPGLPGGIDPGHPQVNVASHSIDFHGSNVAPNDEMTSIKPFEEKLIEFKAEYAGVWMYHGDTEPVLQSIANGLYGMLIVEPKGGLDRVDQEFFLVQSEWYVGRRYPLQPPLPPLSKASAAAPEPDFVVFNGIANQYRDHPIQVETGKRIRAFILDAGPNLGTSFSIEGTVFDRVIKEGVELKVGNPGGWGSQAVDLSPGQGAIVEFTLAEDGLYPIVTHAFNLVGRGASGLFQAGDGNPLN